MKYISNTTKKPFIVSILPPFQIENGIERRQVITKSKIHLFEDIFKNKPLFRLGVMKIEITQRTVKTAVRWNCCKKGKNSQGLRYVRPMRIRGRNKPKAFECLL